MGEKDMLLYWISGSVPCWRVMIVLHEKGLTDRCVCKEVDFVKGEQKSTEILELNPRGQTPTFTCGDLVINESMAICDFLEEKFKSQGPVLMPKGETSRAEVQQKLHESYYNLQKSIVENIIYYKWLTKPEHVDDELLNQRHKAARNEIDMWNTYLAKDKHDYIAGDEFTMADIVFYTFLAMFIRMGLSIEQHPHLLRYYERLTERPSIRETWPPSWKIENGEEGTSSFGLSMLLDV